jgi:hypothetical protein
LRIRLPKCFTALPFGAEIPKFVKSRRLEQRHIKTHTPGYGDFATDA